jgi:hypothetical protein
VSGFWRRHVANVAVIAAAAGLGLWVFAIEPNLPSSGELEQREKHVFRAFSRSGLTAIELTPAAGPAIALARANDAEAWSLRVGGAAAEGDEAAIDKLAAAIEYATVLRDVPAGSFGLDAPRLRGAIVVRGERQAFAIGSEAPGAPGTAYVQVAGGPVRVASAAFVAEVLAPASRLFDRRVVPYLSIETKRVELARGAAPPLAFERTDDRLWHLAGRADRVARPASDAFWAAIADLTSERELPEGAWSEGGDALTVSLAPRDGRPTAVLAMRVGCKDGPGATLRLTGPRTRVVCVGRGAYDRLAAIDVASLVDHAPIASRPDEIQALRVTVGGESFEVARVGSGFRVRGAEEREVPGELHEDVTAWFEELGRAATPAPAAKVAAGEPLGTIEVYAAEREPAEVLAILARDAEGAILRRNADGALLAVGPALALRLDPRGAWLRPRNVFEGGLASRAVQRVELACDGVREVVARGPGGWSFVEPAGAPVDAARALDVATKLLGARADRWLDGAEVPRNTACRAAVVVEGDAGPIRAELRIGERREGAFVASAEGLPGAFLLPKATRDLATVSLVDRNLGPGDLGEAFAVTLSRGKRDAILERTPKGFRLRGAPENAALPERVTALVAGLVADAVLHPGAPVTADGLAPPRAAIVWTAQGGKVLGELRFGGVVAKNGERFVAVASPRGGAVLGIREATFDALFEALP